MVQDVYEAKSEDTNHVKSQWQEKQKEVAVVSPPDAVVHPGTVMIKVLKDWESVGGNTKNQLFAGMV